MTHVDLTNPRADALTYSQLRKDQHFELSELAGRWHWESIGPCEDFGLCSEDGFETSALAADEARDTLALASAYGVETALALMDDFAHTMACLYPSDREAIYGAIEVLPIDKRWVAAFEMAKRTTPMLARYCPGGEAAIA